MSNKPKEKPVRDPSDPLVWDVENLASATECTGLVPSAIQTSEEAEDYANLYAIHLQKTAWTREENGKPEQRGKSD
ncbi:MAG: hypothetical protein IKK75_14175 [Clostridia bacterium]|nr:hypothetical protein [Clostridia bacterium]